MPQFHWDVDKAIESTVLVFLWRNRAWMVNTHVYTIPRQTDGLVAKGASTDDDGNGEDVDGTPELLLRCHGRKGVARSRTVVPFWNRPYLQTLGRFRGRSEGTQEVRKRGLSQQDPLELSDLEQG